MGGCWRRRRRCRALWWGGRRRGWARTRKTERVVIKRPRELWKLELRELGSRFGLGAA